MATRHGTGAGEAIIGTSAAVSIQARGGDHTPKGSCDKPDGTVVELADIAAGQGAASPSTASARTTAPASR